MRLLYRSGVKSVEAMTISQTIILILIIIAGFWMSWLDRPASFKKEVYICIFGIALVVGTTTMLYVGRLLLGFHTDVLALLTLRPSSFGAIFIPVGYSLIVKSIFSLLLIPYEKLKIRLTPKRGQ